MPKTPFQNSSNTDDALDSQQTDDVAGRDAAANLARQKLEEAYANDPPNKEAALAAAREAEEGSEENEDEEQPEDGEIRIEHEEKTEESAAEQSQLSWKDKQLPNDKAVQEENSLDMDKQDDDKGSDEKSSVYDRSHDDSAAYAAAAKQWQNYHSSWQQYYQQYYERYYLTQMKNKPTDGKSTPGDDVSSIISSDRPEQAPTNEIRSQLLSKAQERAKAVRKSRHFMPILTALCVGLLFTFLQYNRLLIAQVQAYISPGNINAQNIVVDPNADVKVGPEPRLIIPKINVDAPIIFGVDSYNEPAVQEALKKGVVDYPIPGADAKPGQVGNMPILGHSSNDVFDDGAYKFVFVQLSQLNEGDTFYIHYKSIRYTYSVTSKAIIDPKEVSKLAIETDEPLVTLITCEPPGTALKRLIVTAKQISPDPLAASKPEAKEEPKEKPKDISGNSPTVLQRLFQ